MSQAQLQSTARASVLAAFPDIAQGDIELVAFVVMMEATHEEDADLRQAMDEMKQNNAKKQGAHGAQKSSADQMSDLGSMDQMRLQMAMDRRSKLIEALSNILKKTSDTSDSVIQNLK